MAANGNHLAAEEQFALEDPILEPGGLDSGPPSQQAIVQHYAFLKKLRVLHYLGNLYATRVVPAFEEWQRLRTAASEWIKAESDRCQARRTAIETEIKVLRDQRDDVQRKREEAEIAYGQAQAWSQEKVDLAPFPTIGGGSDKGRSRDGTWAHALAAVGKKMEPCFGFLPALICGAVLGLCFGTLFGITSIDDIQKGDWHPAAFAAMAGVMIVFLLGKGMDFTVRMYADRVGPNGRGAWLPWIVMFMGILLFIAAEVTLEGHGLEQVHSDHLLSALRQRGEAAELHLQMFPLYLYLLLGVLVSGPYLWCKLGAAWYRPRPETLAAASVAGEDGSAAVEGGTETTQRLVTAGIECRQLRERCEEFDRRIGRLKDEHRTLEPVDAPVGALLEQVRAAEATYRTERDRYDKLLESLIFLRAPRVESPPGQL